MIYKRFVCEKNWSWQKIMILAKVMILAEDHDPGGESWSWQKIMILAEDHDSGRRSWSWQNSMFLLEQYGFAGIQRTTVRGPPWHHLGTIFGQVRKFMSRRLGIDLGSNLLLEAGLDGKFYTATKCRLPYVSSIVQYVSKYALCSHAHILDGLHWL